MEKLLVELTVVWKADYSVYLSELSKAEKLVDLLVDSAVAEWVGQLAAKTVGKLVELSVENLVGKKAACWVF